MNKSLFNLGAVMMGLQASFNSEQYAALQLVASFSGSLSVLSIILVLAGICGSKKKQWNFSSRAIVILLVMNLLFSGAAMFGRALDGNETSCSFQGFIIQFSGLAIVLWTSVTAYYMYSWVVKRKHAGKIDKRVSRDLAVVLLLAAIPSFTFLFLDYYKVTAMWCWIDSKYEEARFWGFWFLVIFAWTFCVLVLALISGITSGKSGVVSTSALVEKARLSRGETLVFYQLCAYVLILIELIELIGF